MTQWECYDLKFLKTNVYNLSNIGDDFSQAELKRRIWVQKKKIVVFGTFPFLAVQWRQEDVLDNYSSSPNGL